MFAEPGGDINAAGEKEGWELPYLGLQH